MRRSTFSVTWLCGLLSGVLLLSQPVLPQDRLKVLTRSEYLDRQTIEEFQSETGLSIEQHVFNPDTDQDLVANLMNGTEAIDLAILPVNILIELIENNRAEPIDQNLSGLHQISRDVVRFLTRYNRSPERPIRLYGVPFIWGTTGIGYATSENPSKQSDDAIPDLTLMFDARQLQAYADCGVGLPDAPGEVIGAALRVLGRDPASRQPSDLKAAEALLMSIRPYIKGFYGAEIGAKLTDGDLCLAMGWSGDILRAVRTAKSGIKPHDLSFVLPKEGGPMWLDIMTVPKSASNRAGAYALMQKLLDASVAARISRMTLYPSTNIAANKVNRDAGPFDDAQILPPWEVIDTMFILPPPSRGELETLQAIWNRFKAG